MDKRRGRPFPDAVILKPIAFDLEEALHVENIYRPNLLAVSQNDYKPGEVTLSLRDEAVSVLRFLRVWLDLPHSVFFCAVSYLDIMLAKMKVQEKFLKCLTLSCLCLAAEDKGCKINVDHLVKISQSKFSSRDVNRMTNIVKEKIKSVKKTENNRVVTPEDFLKIYLEIFKHLTKEWEHIITRELNKMRERMPILLEVLLSDSSTAFFRPSVLALTVFQSEVENIMAKGLPNKSLYFLGEFIQFLQIIREIQLYCKIKNAELKSCLMHTSKVFKQYGSRKGRTSQQLNWIFSLSTIQTSMKRSSYHPYFQTIKE